MSGSMPGALAEQIVLAARKIEDHVDAEIQALDAVDDEALVALRSQKVRTMKHLADKRSAWLDSGHGEYSEVYSDKEFFEQTRGEERVICHFYRDNLACQVMHQRLSTLAKEHVEAKVVKVLAERSPFLAERLRIWMLPTLAIIRNGKTVDYIVGLDEFSETLDFSAEALEDRLRKTDILLPNKDLKKDATHNRTFRHGFSNRGRDIDSDEDSDFG